jgi:hypothetical protein
MQPFCKSKQEHYKGYRKKKALFKIASIYLILFLINLNIKYNVLNFHINL